VYKPAYSKPIPPGAKIVQHKGRPCVRYTYRDGESVLAKVTKDGQGCLVPRRTWVVEYRDADGIIQTVTGYSDRAATEQLAARLERQAARQQEGMVDGFAEHLRRPLSEHLDDFEKALAAKNNTPEYVKLVVARIRALLAGCEFHRVGDIRASRVAEW